MSLEPESRRARREIAEVARGMLNGALEALAKLQPKIDSAEKWAQEIGRAKCQRLIDRFGAVPD